MANSLYKKYEYQVDTEAFWFQKELAPTICYLNSNNANDWNYFAFGEKQRWTKWKKFKTEKPEGKWVFGLLSYSLKDIFLFEEEEAKAGAFPELFQFEPEWIIRFRRGVVEIYGDPHFDKKEYDVWIDELFLGNIQSGSVLPGEPAGLRLTPRTPIHRYLFNVADIKRHIQRGDIYETNYCQEFYSREKIDPINTYWALNQKTKPPFSAYFQFDSRYILSASPERFIRKTGNHLISQPIKGTAPRMENAQEDQRIADELVQNQKERSENVMIVDLVRNDLAKVALKGSVEVEKLCEIVSFQTVHQLVSTVGCELAKDVQWHEVIAAAFPMGSMTGAPKKKAVELMSKLEDFNREVYSGGIGYFNPEGDFDFNVVIRSIIYNELMPYLSVPVGGAITIASDAEKEYQECLLKLKAIKEVLEN